jgi:hypothetical protein
MKTVSSVARAFPRATLYTDLLKPRPRLVRESPPHDPSFPWLERHLQCVWFDPAWRPSRLSTSEGEPVTVEDPGRWNLEAGPDFLDAVLTIGPARRTLEGDVEVHVRPADWRAHGHARDPAYARVIAHVSYFGGPARETTLPPGAVWMALKDPLAANPAFSFESIDLTAYPYASLPKEPPPCAGALRSWDPDRRGALLDAAGEERLRIKAARIRERLDSHDPDQVLYEEIMCALGYKRNRVPFRELACRLPLAGVRDESGGDPVKACALFLGVAGLIPKKPSPQWDEETRAFVRKLWDNWWKQQSRWESRVMPAGSWRLAGLRPPNHPVRRLAAAAGLFAADTSLAARLAVSGRPHNPGRWLADTEALFARIDRPLHYWKRRLSFSTRPLASDVALIGPPRVAAILSNIVVPFLAATDRPVETLLSRLPAEQDNALVRQAAHRLFGHDHNPALYANGLRQQGLLQIFHDFCLNNRTGCRDCTLESALRNASPTDFLAEGGRVIHSSRRLVRLRRKTPAL